MSAQAIGLLARYLRDRVDGDVRRVSLEDMSGLDEDQEAIEELLEAGMVVVVLPAGDLFESMFLPTDPQAAGAASVEEAIAYLHGAGDDIDGGSGLDEDAWS